MIEATDIRQPESAETGEAKGCSLHSLVLPIRPYHQEASVTIYHGDCREIAPLLPRFDLLLTDPPYGIRADENPVRGQSKHGKSAWDRERPAPWVLQMLISKAATSIIWGGNYFADVLPPTMKWLVWNKDTRNFSLADCELAWTSMDAAARVLDYSRAKANQDVKQHPTQKPMELILWCIAQAGEVQTILDPYAGSGTTGRAAKDLGKKAVLIERDERYCEIAAKRLSQDVLALDGQNAKVSHGRAQP
jgi:DNA modification methylase